ncbi:hypothetical protein PF66_01744 [Pseudomonas asplenii]|uniref:Uncharacterized protein n=1 Tax=Pseudomonas asplenii TaxID=53407 RepID=A0A0M9GHZ6_9PSED|nr:hypothetical protein PF66_01744 [Pseudomonas fuscovaginae]
MHVDKVTLTIDFSERPISPIKILAEFEFVLFSSFNFFRSSFYQLKRVINTVFRNMNMMYFSVDSRSSDQPYIAIVLGHLLKITDIHLGKATHERTLTCLLTGHLRCFLPSKHAFSQKALHSFFDEVRTKVSKTHFLGWIELYIFD